MPHSPVTIPRNHRVPEDQIQLKQSIKHAASIIHEAKLRVRADKRAPDNEMRAHAARRRNTMDDLHGARARAVGAGAEDAGEGVRVGRRGGAAHAPEERERCGKVEAAGVCADERVVEERRGRAGRLVQQAAGQGEVSARGVGAEEEQTEVGGAVGGGGGSHNEARVELLSVGDG